MAIEYRTEPEYWEYLDGTVHPKVSPRQRHAVVQGTLFAMHGSLVVLDVDPLERTVRVYDRDGSRVLAAGDRFAHHAVPWLVFEVDDVFSDLDIPK